MVENRSAKKRSKHVAALTGLPTREATQLLEDPRNQQPRPAADPLTILPPDTARQVTAAIAAAKVNKVRHARGLLTSQAKTDLLVPDDWRAAVMKAAVQAAEVSDLIASPWNEAAREKLTDADVPRLVEFALNRDGLSLTEGAFTLLTKAAPYARDTKWDLNDTARSLIEALRAVLDQRLSVKDLDEVEDSELITITATDVLEVIDEFIWRPQLGERTVELGTFSWQEHAPDEAGAALCVPVGVDTQTKRVVSLTLGGEAVHGLVQGAASGGRLSMVRGMLLGLASCYRADQVNFVLLDSGYEAFAGMEELPHTQAVIDHLATDKTGLAAHNLRAVLAALWAEADRRKQLLRSVEARTISDYRALQDSGQDDLEPLPQLILVVNDLSGMLNDLNDGADLADTLQNLVRLGRAVGLTVIFSQPSTALPFIGFGLRENLSWEVGVPDYSGAPNRDTLAPRMTGFRPAQDGCWLWTADSRDITFATQTATLPTIADVAATLPEERQQRPSQIWDPNPPVQNVFDIADLAGPRSAEEQAERLTLAIGSLDDPEHQRRRALTVDVHESIRVVGDPGTEVQETLETIIVAAGAQAGPHIAQFYVLDHSDGPTPSLPVGDYANVLRYERYTRDPSGDSSAAAILSELETLIKTREGVMADWGNESFGQYWTRKQSEPVAGDPYGHVCLVIVDEQDYLDKVDGRDNVDGKGSRVKNLIRKGPAVGVHVIAGSTAAGMSPLDKSYGKQIHHRVADPHADKLMTLDLKAREAVRKIPNVKGYVYDSSTGLYGQITRP